MVRAQRDLREDNEGGKCWNAACGQPLSRQSVLRCSRCARAVYCSKECQVRDWKRGHKGSCVRAQGTASSCSTAAASAKDTSRIDAINVLYSLGASQFQQGCYDDARKSFESVKTVAVERGDRAALMNACINLGACYYAHGIREQSQTGHEQRDSIAEYLQALTIAEETGNRAEQVKILGSLGACHALLKQYDESRLVYQQALHIADEIGDALWRDKAERGLSKLRICHAADEMRASLKLAEFHHERQFYSKAISHYQESKHKAREIGDKKTRLQACMGLASCFSALEQVAKHFGLDTIKKNWPCARACIALLCLTSLL